MSSRAYRHGWFAPMEDESLDIRRWLLPRVDRRCDAAARCGHDRAGRLRRRRARRARQRRRLRARAPRPRRSSGSSSSSSGTPAAPATTPAGSCGTATTRPAYVRLTCEAYDDWAGLERDSGEHAGHRGRRARPVPAGRGDRPVDYTDVARRGRRSPSRCSTRAEIDRALAAVPAARRARWRCTRRDAAIVPAGRGTATMQDDAARARRRAARRSHPVTAVRDLGEGGLEVRTPQRRRSAAGGLVVSADAWTNDVLAGARRAGAAEVTLEQVTYFAPERPGRFAPGRLPLWIWMDDPSLLRLPDLRRGDGQGGPGLRRRRSSTPTAAPSSPTRRWPARLAALHGGDCSRAAAGRCARCAASTR